MKCVENPRAVSHGAAQSAPPRRRTNPGKIARRAGTTILALLFCVVWFFPVYWMIITAVKPRDEIMTTTPVFWPMHLSIVLSIIVGFFLNIPKDIFESAAVEGANDWQILWKITFPLAAPGIVSTSVFAFINAWNDYMIAHTFMKDQSKYTLPVWLSSFSTPTMGTDFGGQMAASVTFSLPVVVFFMLIQRNIMKGVTTGAVK